MPRDRTLGIGVVGLGRAGAYYLEQLAMRDDCRVVAAFDTCPVVRRNLARLAGEVPDHPRAILADSRIEAVIVATPPATLADLAEEVLTAGKHALVESPAALLPGRLDQLARIEKNCRRSVIVAHTWRFERNFCAAREIVQSGRLGRTLSLQLASWQYNPWLQGQAHSARGNAAAPPLAPPWNHAYATGGGVLWQFGVRYIDQMLVLAGQMPVAVWARLFESSAHPGLDDGFLALFRFRDGLVAQIDARRASPVARETGWVVHADQGAFAEATEFQATPSGEVIDLPVGDSAATPGGFLDAALAHLRGEAANPGALCEAHAVLCLVGAARRAAACGQFVPVAEAAPQSES